MMEKSVAEIVKIHIKNYLVYNLLNPDLTFQKIIQIIVNEKINNAPYLLSMLFFSSLNPSC